LRTTPRGIDRDTLGHGVWISEAVFGHLASDLEAILSDGVTVERNRSLDACVTEIMEFLRAEDTRRYILVWLEIVAAAGIGNESLKSLAHKY
jgi:hypothetical protein